MAGLGGCRYHTRPFGRAAPTRPVIARRSMASYTTSEIRGGLKVLLDGDPYAVIENEFVKPGKGQAFNRIKVRNLKTGRTIEQHLQVRRVARGGRRRRHRHAVPVPGRGLLALHGAGELRAVHRRQGRGGRQRAVAQGRHGLHRHAVEQRAAGGDAAAAHRAEGRRDRPGAARRHRHRRSEDAPSSRPVPWSACRCSSTKAKCCASTRAPASTSRAPSSRPFRRPRAAGVRARHSPSAA